MAKRLEFLPIEDFYSAVFPDFKVTIPFGWEAAEDAYCENFPEEREGIHRILEFMRKLQKELAVVSTNPGPLDLLSFPVTGSHLIRSTGLTTSQALAGA